jgi:hypothetical protein
MVVELGMWLGSKRRKLRAELWWTNLVGNSLSEDQGDGRLTLRCILGRSVMRNAGG